MYYLENVVFSVELVLLYLLLLISICCFWSEKSSELLSVCSILVEGRAMAVRIHDDTRELVIFAVHNYVIEAEEAKNICKEIEEARKAALLSPTRRSCWLP